jgi:hypothetical protein
MAALNEVGYWNLFQAMGGEGSIVKMSETKPAQARKDYAHITREGGTVLSEYYFKAIKAGFEQYKIMEE